MKEFSIGQLAEQSGVTTSSLRYYERVGLIKKVRRSESNYRYYPAETLNIIKLIKNAQAIGFSLQEIEEILLSRENQQQDCHDIVSMVKHKQREVDNEVLELQKKQQRLQSLIECCDGVARVQECPILCELLV